MTGTKLFARILFFVTRFLAFLYFALTLISFIALTTGWGLGIKDEGKHFVVFYPFTTKPLMLGEYNLPYIIFYFLSVIGLYGLFFLLVSNVFKVFYQPKLFTAFGVRHLKRFYLANFIIPGALVLVTSFFTEVDDSSEILVALHFILGVFAFFLATIFKQGLNLQNEQDLFI